MKTLEIFYETYEKTPGSIVLDFDGDVLKFCEELMKKGFNLKRSTDEVFIPAHRIWHVQHGVKK